MKLYNLMIPEEWIEQLKQIARKESVKQTNDISVSHLIRKAIEEKYQLGGKK